MSAVALALNVILPPFANEIGYAFELLFANPAQSSAPVGNSNVCEKTAPAKTPSKTGFTELVVCALEIPKVINVISKVYKLFI